MLEETYNLYRIRALKDFGDVKAGDLGGYIESERNLSQEGDCWVYDKAKVTDEAKIYGNAKIKGYVVISDNAEVFDNAKVYDYADVRDNAKVYGNAEVSKKTKMYGFTEVGGDIKIIDNVEVKENSENETKKYELTENTIEQNGRTLYQIRALKDFEDVMAGDLGGYIEKEENLSQEGNCWVSDEARVYGNAQVFGKAQVYENAEIHNDTKIYGKAEIYGEADVWGNAQVYENAQVYGNAQIYEKAQIYENAQLFENAQVRGNAQVYGEAKVFGNAQVYNKAKIYDKAEIFTDIEIGGETEVKGNEKIFNHSQYIDNLAKVYDNITTDEKTKTYDFSHKKDYSSNLENEIQKYEEHCSKVVDKLKLQDELPDFQVISQKGLLYERNGEENNISEIKNFIENLKGEEYWDNMNLKDIRDWKELKNDEFVSIVYETKDDKGNVELEEFTDYNDYAKDTVKNALEKEFKNNPDTIESLRKDILDKVPNKEVVKEKVEVEKEIEKEEKTSNKTFGYRSDF